MANFRPIPFRPIPGTLVLEMTMRILEILQKSMAAGHCTERESGAILSAVMYYRKADVKPGQPLSDSLSALEELRGGKVEKPAVAGKVGA